MADKTVVDYIQAQKRKGVVRAAIVTELKKAGWTDVQIDEGFSSTESEATQTSSSILLGPVELIKRTYQIFKLRWKVYTLISFIVGVINLSLSGALSALFVSNIPALTEFSLIMLLLPVLFILVWFIGMYGSMALYASVAMHREGIGVGESLLRPWHKIGPLTLTFALYGLIVLAGYVFLIIPGIVFIMWFIFGMYLSFERNVSGLDALLLSREYVKGLEVEVFWRLLAGGLIIAGIFIGVMIPFGILSGLVTFSLGNEASTVLSIFQFIVNASAQAIMVPATTIYTYLIFDNVKSIKGDVSVPKNANLRTGLYFIAGVGLVLLIGIPIAVVSIVKAIPYPLLDRQQPDYYAPYDSPMYQEQPPSIPGDQNLDVKMKSDLLTLQVALELYHSDHGEYPLALSDLTPVYLNTIPEGFSYNQLLAEDNYWLCIVNSIYGCYSKNDR